MLAGGLLHRTGMRPLIGGGLLLGAFGVLVTLLLTPGAVPLLASGRSPAWVVPGLVLAGAGLGIVMVAGSAAIISGAPPHRAGMASSIKSVSYELGSLAGVTVLGTILTAVYTSTIRLPATASAQAAGSIDQARAAAGHLPPAKPAPCWTPPPAPSTMATPSPWPSPPSPWPQAAPSPTATSSGSSLPPQNRPSTPNRPRAVASSLSRPAPEDEPPRLPKRHVQPSPPQEFPMTVHVSSRAADEVSRLPAAAWLVLAIVLVADIMDLLDSTITTIAAPTMSS